MGRWLKSIVVLAAVMLFSVISTFGAKAAHIYGVCDSSETPYLFLNDGTGTFYYSVAKEVYSNAAGASSRIAKVIVQRSMVLNARDSINLKLTNASFNPDNTVYYALLVDNNTADADNITAQLNVINGLVGQDVTSSDYLAAITSSTISSPTPNLAFMVDNASLTSATSNKFMFLAQVVVDNETAGTYKVIHIGSAVNIDPGLNPTCTTNPEILISVTMPNESKSNDVFAKILPKCGPYAVGYNLEKLTAELNTDENFKQFKGGDAVIDALTIQTCNPYTCGGSSTCSACSGNCGVSATGGGAAGGTTTCGPDWIVGYGDICPTTADVSFTLTSSTAEPAVTVSYGNDNTTLVKCSTTDHKTWTCSAKDIDISATGSIDGCLQIKANGTDKMLPTTWSISDISVTTYKDGNEMDVCTVNTYSGVAGSWYGGLEAIIPFLKYGNGYQTYVKLFNRNDMDADVYVVTFGVSSISRAAATSVTNTSAPQLVALKLLGTIPANGSKQFTAEEIGEALGLTPDQMAWGFPVKLMIMAPSSKGCMNIVPGTHSLHVCYNNTNDPYIEGIVISVTPNGGQRSIPLEFKYFKNGAYNQ